MEDDEIIEELDDEVIDEPQVFARRTMNNQSINVPSALRNKSMSNKKENVGNNNQNKKNNSPKKPVTKGLPPKDESVANKLKNKKKPLSFLNRRKKDNSDNANEGNSSDEQHSENDNGNSLIEDVALVKRKILMLKIGLIAGVVLIVLFFIIVLIAGIASMLGVGDEFANLGTGSNINSNEPYSKAAKNYYEKLNKATEMYADSCEIYLNRSYIHAVLTYVDMVSQNVDIEEKYKKMADNADDVAKLMVSNCVVDYEIGGVFYNNLKNSSFLKKYYSSVLEYMDADTLVTNIFEYAEAGIELASLTAGYISDNLKVNMGTCEQPYNKKLLNEGTRYSSTVGFRDYIMGTIYAEAEDHITEEKREFLKVFTIVTTSYVLSRSEYKSGSNEIWVHNGNCWQVSCDINEGCHYTKKLPGGYGTAFTGPDETGKYWKKPMSATQRAILDEVFKEVFGTVMLNPSGGIIWASHYDKVSNCSGGNNGCMGQDDAALDAKNGMKYLEILEKYYDSYTLSNMKEDSYAPDVKYDDGGYTGSVVYYDQTDYNNKFCGLSSQTIKGSGCGVTSMAMILSTFVDSSYTPPVVMEEAYGGRYCGKGISGTSVDFFKFSAAKHGLGYQSVSKKGNLQLVLDALQTGNSLVVAHMGQGLFTNSGHYIVLTKVNDKGQVYVLDSYKSRRTGWHDFDEVVVKQLKSYGKFHIITKR